MIMDNPKSLLLEIKHSLDSFAAALVLDKSTNTLTVISKYDQVLDILGRIAPDSPVQQDVQDLLQVFDNLDSIIAKAAGLELRDALKATLTDYLANARKELATYYSNYNLDERVEDVMAAFGVIFTDPPKTQKEILRQRDALLAKLDNQSALTRNFILRFSDFVRQQMGAVNGTEDFARIIVVANLLEVLIFVEDLKSRENVALLEKYLAKLVMMSMKEMAATMEFLVVIRNAKVMMKQLPPRLKQLVISALPARWKDSMNNEESVSFSPAMHDRLFGSAVKGLSIKKLAMGNTLQDDIIRLLDNIKATGMTRNSLGQHLFSQSRAFTEEFMKLLAEPDRAAIADMITRPLESGQVIRRTT